MTVDELNRKLAISGARACGALQAMVDCDAVPNAMLPLVVAILIEHREHLAEARSQAAINRAQEAARAA